MARQSGKAPAKYRQIAADLRDRIAGGEYPVGTQLPTKQELAAEHKAAVGTVDDALAVLRDLGLVETRQGAGTFVISAQPGESEAQQLSEQVAGLRAQVAELAKRVEAAEDAGLRDLVSDIQTKLVDLYGKTGFDYYAGGEATSTRGQPKRAARNG